VARCRARARAAHHRRTRRPRVKASRSCCGN
jgi:hypothetical protein